jgi:hypothetical protein
MRRGGRRRMGVGSAGMHEEATALEICRRRVAGAGGMLILCYAVLG